MPLDPVEGLLKRDRQVVVIALVLVTLLAWVYTLAGVGVGMSAFEMSPSPWPGTGAGSEGMAMDMGPGRMDMGSFVPAGYVALLLMWWLMMIAMMLPSAAPTILLAAAINRRTQSEQPPYGAAAWFTAGYLLIWLVFSVFAVVTQVWLESSGRLSTMMHSNSRTLSALLLCAAGLWQFTPIKQACLRHCRSPVHFLTAHRKPGSSGALQMGMGHGAFCLGCCWFLMALLFAGGIMNVYWIAGLALFVLLEKTISRGELFGRISGAMLVIAGIALAVT